MWGGACGRRGIDKNGAGQGSRAEPIRASGAGPGMRGLEWGEAWKGY